MGIHEDQWRDVVVESESPKLRSIKRPMAVVSDHAGHHHKAAESLERRADPTAKFAARRSAAIFYRECEGTSCVTGCGYDIRRVDARQPCGPEPFAFGVRDEPILSDDAQVDCIAQLCARILRIALDAETKIGERDLELGWRGEEKRAERDVGIVRDLLGLPNGWPTPTVHPVLPMREPCGQRRISLLRTFFGPTENCGCDGKLAAHGDSCLEAVVMSLRSEACSGGPIGSPKGPRVEAVRND
ncbi:hypothetical protein [Microbacterium suaedae]|uniref:hypothetical protein n=1 Tax=Microbacterium suaedae TaxID=2067813 RepID=UPI0013A60FEE|nr:hypothetical protein [Microbacterium suaedae]